ncbi:MAG: EamA family transporter [Opitutales bacterium]
MTSEIAGIGLVVAASAVESFAQIFLKVGAAGGPDILALPFRQLAHRWPAGSSARGWLAWGLAAYGAEIFLYTLALHHLEVSVAFPLGSLCFVGVALLSRLFLGEKVGRVRWLGVVCILLGTICLTL